MVKVVGNEVWEVVILSETDSFSVGQSGWDFDAVNTDVGCEIVLGKRRQLEDGLVRPDPFSAVGRCRHVPASRR